MRISDGSSDVCSSDLISVDADSYSSLAFGTVTHVTTPIDSTISTKIEPPREDRYDLDPGQSYMQTYTVSSSGTASSGGISFPIPGTDPHRPFKRTYVARSERRREGKG